MLLASAAFAGPVLNADGLDPSGLSTNGSPSNAGTSARAVESSTGSGINTGNKNLDLLLELQDRAAVDPSAPGGARADESKAPADQRAPASQKPSSEGAHKPALQSVEALATPEIAIRAAPTVPRRDWTAHPATDEPFDASPRGYGGDGRSAGPSSDAVDDAEFLRRLPREVIEFLRQNSYWLLAGLAAAAAIGAGLKAYSRRI